MNYVFSEDTEPDALRDFKRIESLIKTGHENEAIVSVADFLRRFPKHELADDAQFALGEIYFLSRDFKTAITEFQSIAKMKIPTDTLADAGLRIGECWKNLNENHKAQIEWNAVVRRFPDSEAAQKAKVFLMGEK